MPPQQPQNPNPAPTPPPMPPQMPQPQQETKHTMLPALLVLLAFVSLCSGAYLLWAKGFLDRFLMPQQVTEESTTPPPKTETSDLEAELESVELNSDAEIESLEAQI